MCLNGWQTRTEKKGGHDELNSNNNNSLDLFNFNNHVKELGGGYDLLSAKGQGLSKKDNRH